MGNDEQRLGLACVNEVRQLAVVGLNVRLTGSYVLALEPEEAHVERDLTLLGQFVGTPSCVLYRLLDGNEGSKSLC